MGRFNGRASYEQVWELAMVLLGGRPKGCYPVDTLREALREAVRQIEDALDEDGGFVDQDPAGPHPMDPDAGETGGVTYVVTRDEGLVVKYDDDGDDPRV